jgi:oligosaccharide reducing-end xylanase
MRQKNNFIYEFAIIRCLFACINVCIVILCCYFIFAKKLHAQIIPPLVKQGAYQTNIYRNLFSDIGKTPNEIQAKIDAAWANYFTSSDENVRLYYPFNATEAYILNIQDNDIRSEGMSYGMMIAVQMNKPDEFNKLWLFAKNRMKNMTGDHKGYFCWQMRRDGTCIDNGAAPDGEEYFAMSLLFAANRWNNDIYRSEALILLNDMLHKPKSGIINSMFNLNNNQIVFSPVGGASEFTNPSYHLPAFYHLFSLWGPAADKAIWENIRDTSRNFLNLSTTKSPACLNPEYANFDGTPHAGYDGATNSYIKSEQLQSRNDSWRTIFNWSIDYAWFAEDTRQNNLSNCLLSFFNDTNKGGGLISNGTIYTANYWQYNNIDGTLNNNYLPNLNTLTGGINYKASAGLIAMNSAGVLAASTTQNWPLKFVENLWSVAIPQGKYRYYDGMLYMLGLLATAGQYKIYAPPPPPPINKILNGYFNNGLNNWTININNTANAIFSVINQQLNINIKNAAWNSNSIEMMQTVSVSKNKIYQLDFDARITEGYSRTIYAGLEQGNMNNLYYSITRFTLKSNVQHFKYAFSALTQDDANAKLKFLFGANSNDIEIDNIELTAL